MEVLQVLQVCNARHTVSENYDAEKSARGNGCVCVHTANGCVVCTHSFTEGCNCGDELWEQFLKLLSISFDNVDDQRA